VRDLKKCNENSCVHLGVDAQRNTCSLRGTFSRVTASILARMRTSVYLVAKLDGARPTGDESVLIRLSSIILVIPYGNSIQDSR
jgi:hypothetical protein